MSNIEEAIKMWEAFRAGTIAELENIPEEHWDDRPGEGGRSLRELARHAAEASVAFTNELLSAEPDFRSLLGKVQAQKPMTQLHDASSKRELVQLMKDTGSANAKRLRDAADRLAASDMPAGANARQSRLTGIWFAAAHEMYHRGQMALYARRAGEVPAMTKKMMGK